MIKSARRCCAFGGNLCGTHNPRLLQYILFYVSLSTYGHRLKNNRHPVRSAKDKLQIDQLVVGWVTTSEYWLLYVFYIFFPPNLRTGRVGDESIPWLLPPHKLLHIFRMKLFLEKLHHCCKAVLCPSGP